MPLEISLRAIRAPKAGGVSEPAKRNTPTPIRSMALISSTTSSGSRTEKREENWRCTQKWQRPPGTAEGFGHDVDPDLSLAATVYGIAPLPLRVGVEPGGLPYPSFGPVDQVRDPSPLGRRRDIGEDGRLVPGIGMRARGPQYLEEGLFSLARDAEVEGAPLEDPLLVELRGSLRRRSGSRSRRA